MKRSPLERRTELRADPDKVRAWQRRSRRPLPAKSPKRAELDEQTLALRRAVAARPCALQPLSKLRPGPGMCAGPGTCHHLRKASAGGPTTPENLLSLCSRHNVWVEDHPRLAQHLGLVVNGRIDHGEALLRRIAAGIG